MNHTSSPLHVVLGAGPAGTTIVTELVRRGLSVRHVNKGPITDAPTGAETVRADMSAPEQALAATEGASVIYHAINVPYQHQVDLMPGIGATVLDTAARHGAHLVVLDTLYPYGEADGDAITEQTPWAATSRKGRMRAGLDRMYLDAHAEGRARVSLGRSADFYGPNVVQSTLGGAFFPPALTGQAATTFGDIDLPHSYSYLPDIAAGLVDLGTAPAGSADGRVWHLPTVPAHSTRAVIGIVEHLLGQPVEVDILDEPVATGPFDATFMAEYAEMFYQHTTPQNMVSAAFEEAFNRRPTPLSEGLATTISWYEQWLAVGTAQPQ